MNHQSMNSIVISSVFEAVFHRFQKKYAIADKNDAARHNQMVVIELATLSGSAVSLALCARTFGDPDLANRLDQIIVSLPALHNTLRAPA